VTWTRLAAHGPFSLILVSVLLVSSTAQGLEVRITPAAVKHAVEAAAFKDGALTRDAANGLLSLTLRNLRVRFDPTLSRVLLDADAVMAPAWSGTLTMSFRPKALGPKLWLEDIRVEGVGSDLIQNAVRDLLRNALASPGVDLEEKSRSSISASPYSLLIASPTVKDLHVTNAFIIVTLDGTITVD
jgi:hypothetical protein